MSWLSLAQVLTETSQPSSQTEIWLRWSIQMMGLILGPAGVVLFLKSKQSAATDELRNELTPLIKAAQDASDLAAARSLPTSNGFAKGVQESLARIENKVDTHIQDHSRAGMSA